MSGAAMDAIPGYLAQSRDIVQAAIDDPAFCRTIHDIAEVTTKALRNGKKLLLAGNSGSAADAQRLAGEMLSRLNYDRAPAAAIALTTDTSVLTAIGRFSATAVPETSRSRDRDQYVRQTSCGRSARSAREG